LWRKVKTDDLNIDLKTFTALANDKCELIISDLSTIERFSNAFNCIVRVYYGLNHLNVSDELKRAVLSSIKDNYPCMTFSNLNLCFVNSIEKKQGTSLTRDEFMLPIHSFMAKKKRIESLLQDIELKEHNEQLAVKQAEKFKEHSIEIYNKSIDEFASEFMGTPFEACAIVEDYFENLNEEEYKTCQLNANKKFKEQSNESNSQFYAIIPERHLLAKEIMDMVVFKHNTNK